jgi:secreted Zn-dependent insulinase-like peptidase
LPKQRGIDIRQILLDFHQAQYSSNRMSLAVLGNRMYLVLIDLLKKKLFLETLDELQSLVLQSFKDIPNKKLDEAKYTSDPYGASQRKVCFFIYPFLFILFFFKRQFAMWFLLKNIVI